MAMLVSLSITNFSWPDGPVALADRLAATARAAETAGLDTVWVPDHPMQSDPASRAAEPMLEAYTTLGFLAGQTSRVRLGTLVAAATFRAPALLTKAVTTLDVLSGGRAWLGIGAGYNEDEARAMGMFLPPVPERFERLADTLEIAKRMWSGDESAYHGRREHLEHPIHSPQPLSRPRPPILIGGTGERRTLRLVAEYADACNLFDIPDGGHAVRRQLDVLAQHCADVGRSYDQIERTITTALQPDEPVSRFVERCRTLGGLGIQHVIVITRGRPWTDDGVDTLGAAAAQLADV
jgi:F420-dependent oxidoreductase-like protein